MTEQLRRAYLIKILSETHFTDEMLNDQKIKHIFEQIVKVAIGVELKDDSKTN